MEKKTIRALAIILAILTVVTLAFAGCGKKKQEVTTTTAVTTTETTTETVSHVTRRPNLTATLTDTSRERPTGTTAESIIKDGEAGFADEDPGQTW